MNFKIGNVTFQNGYSPGSCSLGVLRDGIAHIPALPNMDNEHVMKYRKLDKKLPLTPAAIKNRLEAELTSRYSGTGPKYKWNSPLHCSECFTMTKTSASIVIKKFFSQPRENFPYS